MNSSELSTESINPFEAARLLAKNGDIKESKQILSHLWGDAQRSREKDFSLFMAIVEVGCSEEPRALLDTVEALSLGETPFEKFWELRAHDEKAIIFDVMGQLALKVGDKTLALESLARAASLGRDTALIWYQLASLYIENLDMVLGVRYLRRSLQIFSQPEIKLTQKDVDFGSFLGSHPLNTNLGVTEYMKVLLDLTKLAKSKQNLKALREVVLELIHRFPEEEKLRKVRLLVEQAVVKQSLALSASSSRKSAVFKGLNYDLYT